MKIKDMVGNHENFNYHQKFNITLFVRIEASDTE